MRTKSMLLASLVMLLAGCGQLFGPNAPAVDEAIGEKEQMFAQMMIPHHEQALEMADLVPSRTDNQEIVALAEKIRAGQDPEIKVMESWLGAHAGHGEHAGHTMDGMLTEAEMAALAATSGVEFEKLFLEGMIKHHEGALEMLSMLDGTTSYDAQKLKEQIDAAQRAEIAQMKELLANY
jgi:uncharacterized protein (DUF305 family)